jgi:hypothetical protein
MGREDGTQISTLFKKFSHSQTRGNSQLKDLAKVTVT